jgi:hypothetical protein
MNSSQSYSISNTSFPLSEAGVWGKLLKRIKVLDVIAFLVPVTQFLQINVVGRLYMPDVLLACMLPMLFFARGQRLRARLPMIFILLAFLWLFGQVVTDIVRATVFRDYIRGWAKIAFTLVNFCALYLLLHGHRRRFILYAVGLTAGGLISYFVNPNAYAEGLPWKFGYGEPATWFLVLLAAAVIIHKRQGPFFASGVLVGAAALNIFMGFRSLGGICFLAASYLFVQARWAQRLASIRTRPRQVVLIGMVLAIAGVGVIQMYDYTARAGLLGEDAQEKYESQAFGEYGLLVGGRGEMLVSGRAILDSPILGHGSWAKDHEYSLLWNELKRRAGSAASTEDEEGLIPTHSHLLGAWVEAGLLGAIFWVWILSLPARVLLRPLGVMDCLTPLMAFFAFFLIWDVFFSPYGAERRFVTPYYVVVMMTFLGAYRERLSAEVCR